jgi:sulfur-oxidizing protein SoxB
VTGRISASSTASKTAARCAYALTYDDFVALARTYGRMGGMDRVATVVKAIRADRPDALLLDGGDTWQGSATPRSDRGQDMVNVMNALGPTR